MGRRNQKIVEKKTFRQTTDIEIIQKGIIKMR
jgi:hypothetical protein